MRISYSQLDTFRQCPLKWQWQSVEKWTPEEESKALDFGTAFHAMIAEHYTALKELQAAQGDPMTPKQGTRDWYEWKELCELRAQNWVYENTDAGEDKRQRLLWMYDGYVQYHGLDESWIILEVEIRGTVKLGDFEFVYIIDLVVRDMRRGGIWVVDHKTAKDLSDQFAIDLDDQGGLYWWAWNNDPDQNRRFRDEVVGYVRNEIRKRQNVGDLPDATKGKPQTLEQRHKRVTKSTAPGELTIIAQDAHNAAAAMQAVREGRMPVYSSPNPSQCVWKCQFKDVHVQARKNGWDVADAMEAYGFTREDG